MPPKPKKDPTPISNSDPALDHEKIQRQLQRILTSPEFKATKSQREFFQFVVSEALAGRSHEIKSYTIATRVFGRKANFDPNLDPIVSIQANKLLEHKPDFPSKGRVLIEHYIKFEEIVEQVLRGLNKLGLQIEK